jgi:UDP-glucuronate 4-epimerase
MKILVTGAAGFIGFHLVNRLAAQGHEVVGLDNLIAYYDVTLKYNRLKACGIDTGAITENVFLQSETYEKYRFIKLDLADRERMERLFKQEQFDMVVNLAAQAGVRYSLENPHVYISSNITGFLNVLEGCRHNQVKHLVFATSSSVYGESKQIPFNTADPTNHPVSIYAATKKSNEMLAHSYSHLFNLPTTGLRFFTVYGPWGRPDMAYFIFVNKILKGETIKVFNHGNMSRDFTFVDDIVEGVIRTMNKPPQGDPDWSPENPHTGSAKVPYKIYNIGNNAPVSLMEFIETIEQELGIVAEKEMLPMQPGDVPITYADVNDLIDKMGYKPSTSLKEGIKQFVSWYKAYYGIGQ